MLLNQALVLLRMDRTAPRRFAMCRKLILLVLLLSAGLTQAEVSEELDYVRYPVDAARGSLLKALNEATPIREDGQRFHGHAKWHVNWRFWWNEDARGCSIYRSTVALTGRITLPELEQASAANQARFDRYIVNLETHELGHIEHGRRAAAEVDEFLGSLPRAKTCGALEAKVNAAGHAIVDRYSAEDRRYDEATGHGRSQGAAVD